MAFVDTSYFSKVAVPSETSTTSAPQDAAMMQYRFKFNHVFGAESEQEDIFENVGKRM